MATYEKLCIMCGDPFTTGRSDKRTCSPACQKKLQRGGMTVASQVLGPEQTDSFVDETPDEPAAPKTDAVMDDLLERVRIGGDTFSGDQGLNDTIADEKSPQYQHHACDAALQAGASEEACDGCRGITPEDKSLVDTPTTKPKKRKQKIAEQAPNIEVPPSMRDQMDAITERMNERLRAKGLPLILKEPAPEYFVPTGIAELDSLTAGFDPTGSGGFPRKKISEVYGPKGVGKSSLVKTIMKMNPDLKVLFFDAEGGMMGPPENMRIIKGNVVEDIMETLIEMVSALEYDLIIVDSVASLITRKQYEGDPEGKAAMARTFGPYVKKLLAALQPLKNGMPDPAPGTAVLFINQFRSTTQSFGQMEYTVGGKALEYYASLRLEFRSAKKDYIIRDGKLAGQRVRVKVEKTRFGPKDVEFTFPIMFAELQDFNDRYVELLKEMGLR